MTGDYHKAGAAWCPWNSGDPDLLRKRTYETKTAEATTVVHRPFLFPSID